MTPYLKGVLRYETVKSIYDLLTGASCPALGRLEAIYTASQKVRLHFLLSILKLQPKLYGQELGVKPLLLGAKCGERESLINETSTRVVHHYYISVSFSCDLLSTTTAPALWRCNFLAEPGIICQMPFIEMSIQQNIHCTSIETTSINPGSRRGCVK